MRRSGGRHRCTVVACLLLFFFGSRADGQISATLDAGWATIHYDEYLRSSVYSLSPSLRLDYPRSSLVGRGTLSSFESGSRSLNFAAAASTFTGAFGAFRAEFSGSGGATLYNEIGTGHADAGVRLHLIGARAGGWLGGSGGYVDDGIIGSSTARLGTGAWLRAGSLSFITSAMHLRSEQVAVTDFETGVRFSRGALNITSSLGFRVSGDGIPGAKQWGEVSAIWWVARRLALVAAHGRYPSEPGRGTPGGGYTSISVRGSTRAPLLDAPVPRGERPDGAPAIARPVVAQFEARVQSDSSLVISIRAPGARRVEIAGDFTDWAPVELTPTTRSGRFTLRIRAAAGAHKFNVRVDAGEWGLPPGVPVVADDFGGHVGLLVITRGE